MTPVGGISGAMCANAGPPPRREDASSHTAKTETGRALIALAPPARTETTSQHRPQAGFLAHLIATKDQLPQTRERRRGEPEQAVALYAAAGAETPLRPGRKLRRTM